MAARSQVGLMGLMGLMATFIYRCPATGLRVQGWIADDDEGSKEDEDTYQSVTCLACQRAHFVNPKTGKVAAADND